MSGWADAALSGIQTGFNMGQAVKAANRADEQHAEAQGIKQAGADAMAQLPTDASPEDQLAAAADARARAALKANRMDEFATHFKAASEMRDVLNERDLMVAEKQRMATGDLSGYLKPLNRLRDGINYKSLTPTEAGVEITFSTADGKEQKKVVTPDAFKGMVMTLADKRRLRQIEFDNMVKDAEAARDMRKEAYKSGLEINRDAAQSRNRINEAQASAGFEGKGVVKYTRPGENAGEGVLVPDGQGNLREWNAPGGGGAAPGLSKADERMYGEISKVGFKGVENPVAQLEPAQYEAQVRMNALAQNLYFANKNQPNVAGLSAENWIDIARAVTTGSAKRVTLRQGGAAINAIEHNGVYYALPTIAADAPNNARRPASAPAPASAGGKPAAAPTQQQAAFNREAGAAWQGGGTDSRLAVLQQELDTRRAAIASRRNAQGAELSDADVAELQKQVQQIDAEMQAVRKAGTPSPADIAAQPSNLPLPGQPGYAGTPPYVPTQGQPAAAAPRAPAAAPAQSPRAPAALPTGMPPAAPAAMAPADIAAGAPPQPGMVRAPQPLEQDTPTVAAILRNQGLAGLIGALNRAYPPSTAGAGRTGSVQKTVAPNPQVTEVMGLLNNPATRAKGLVLAERLLAAQQVAQR